MPPSSASSPPARSEPVWTEPPCSWFIETTEDALLILEAARRGLIPRVTRRLVDRERRMITSGSVFVFDEDESGIKRWTDGLLWSPSRILGNFLLYRETDKKGTSANANAQAAASNDPTPLLVNDPANTSPPPRKDSNTSLSRPKDGRAQADRNRERALVGSLTNSYKFKPDGMMKKTFSLTINGSAQHLISYYKVADVEEGRLRTPSSLPELSVLDISPEYLDKTHFRCPPKVETDGDGIPRYRGEADDPDSPVRTPVQAPPQHQLQSQPPLLTTGEPAFPYSPGYYSHTTGPGDSYFGTSQPRVARRYEPYGGGGGSSTSSTGSSKRSRSRRGTGSVPPKGYGASGSASPEGAGQNYNGPEQTGYSAPPQYQGYTYGNGGPYTPTSPSGSSSHYSQSYPNTGPPPPPPPVPPAPQYTGYQDRSYTSQPAPAQGPTYYAHSTPTPTSVGSEGYGGYQSQPAGEWMARRDGPGGYAHSGAAWSAEVHGS